MAKLRKRNPRKITDKQVERLKVDLIDLGDLSGVVHDLNSDEIIGGNQRSKIFDINSCKIVMTEEYDEPDSQGTVGWGYILWQDHKYTYRAVRWDERTCDRANIEANKAGGTWDFQELVTDWDLDDLTEWGFEPEELGLADPDPDVKPPKVEGQYEISPELFERHDYLVFIFENEWDWQVATEALGVKTVESAKVGQKTFRSFGTGRVLKAEALLGFLTNADS